MYKNSFNKISLLCCLGFVLLSHLAGAQYITYKKEKDGVLLLFPANTDHTTRTIKLKVVSDKIIRVIASPTANIPADKSLVVIPPSAKKLSWNLSRNGNQLSLHTNSINANISLTTGAVVFTDKSGKTILKEDQDGGKTFLPVILQGKKLYQTRQVFASTPDEAFYGLGQHQQGFFNYKNENLELAQRNTEVAVPFMVSNKNYGILWDNCSITKFGDGRDFAPMSSLQLFDVTGKEGALTATYYSKRDSSKIYLSQPEKTIEYEYLRDMKKFPAAFPLQDGKVKWEGFIASGIAGINKLAVKYAGYIKIWIDGELVLDRWRQSWNPADAVLNVDMERNKKYNLKIDWNPDGGQSYLGCKWLTPLPQEEKDKFSFSSEAGDMIDYYFMYGKNMDEVISGYRIITGKASIMPEWAMGFWQSRERYKTQEDILGVVKEFRQRKIPIDNIVMDWQYWKPDQWGSQDFDTSRFKDAKGMISELHNRYNTHFMVSVWPKFYTGNKNYDLFKSKGFLYTKNIENNQKDWLGYVSTFYDAFNSNARKSFWDLLNKHLYSKGVDAWWLDATEPDIHSNVSIEEQKELMNPTALGSSTEYYNAFSLQNAKGIYEGQRSTDPDKRVFILTRSGFSGLQRYASAVWSGDIAARWSDFKMQIPAGINFSMSGIPYWTMDIGGFAVENRFENATGELLKEWQEQMTRWYQFGTFCPLFRAHGQFPYREIYNVADESNIAYQSMLYYNNLRYRLMPYIYSLAGKTYHENYTIMRGLVMDFPDDKKVTNIGDQYMFGPAILINPVTDYKATTKDVYLPATTGWYDFYSGKYFSGGQQIKADAPMERMPLFVKEGSIIPFGPAIEYIAQKPADTVTLYVYTGKDASFSLYEDEGVNYNYEKGLHSAIAFNYNETSKSLTIEDRKGKFPGMLTNRVFNVVWVKKDKPAAFNLEKKPDASINYSGKKITLAMK